MKPVNLNISIPPRIVLGDDACMMTGFPVFRFPTHPAESAQVLCAPPMENKIKLCCRVSLLLSGLACLIVAIPETRFTHIVRTHDVRSNSKQRNNHPSPNGYAIPFREISHLVQYPETSLGGPSLATCQPRDARLAAVSVWGHLKRSHPRLARRCHSLSFLLPDARRLAQRHTEYYTYIQFSTCKW